MSRNSGYTRHLKDDPHRSQPAEERMYLAICSGLPVPVLMSREVVQVNRGNGPQPGRCQRRRE